MRNLRKKTKEEKELDRLIKQRYRDDMEYTPELKRVLKQVDYLQLDSLGGIGILAGLVETQGEYRTLQMLERLGYLKHMAYTTGDEEYYSEDVANLLKQMNERDVNRLGGKDAIQEAVENYGIVKAKSMYESCGYLKYSLEEYVDDEEDEIE